MVNSTIHRVYYKCAHIPLLLTYFTIPSEVTYPTNIYFVTYYILALVDARDTARNRTKPYPSEGYILVGEKLIIEINEPKTMY